MAIEVTATLKKHQARQSKSVAKHRLLLKDFIPLPTQSDATSSWTTYIYLLSSMQKSYVTFILKSQQPTFLFHCKNS